MSKEQIQLTCKDGFVIRGLAWNVEKAIGNVVIITGMQEHSGRYEDFAKFLNEHKLSVFCLDHFNQGENVLEEGMLGKWEKSGFRKMVNRVDELVERLRITCHPTYLLGHSLGSFIAQDYIERYSTHIKKVILMGSCGPRFITKVGGLLSRIMVHNSNYHKDAKLLKTLTFGSFNKKVQNKKTEFDWLSVNEENVQNYSSDPLCGVDVSNGFYKEFLKGLNRLNIPRFLRKIRRSLPILIVSGKEDPVGLYGKGVEKLAKVYRKQDIVNLEVIIYDNMRHEILFEENKERVYQDILEFILK